MEDNEKLKEIAEELAATRKEPPEGKQRDRFLSLEHGPAFLPDPNPDIKEKTIPAFPAMRQIFIKGMRVGYVTVTPGGPINLLRPWAEGQIAVLQEAILQELALDGWDIDTSRKINVPRAAGLVTPGKGKPKKPERSIIITP